MPHLIYGSRWNENLKMMLDPLTEEQARARYAEGLEVSLACGEVELAAEKPEDLRFRGEEPAVWSLYTELSRSRRSGDQPDTALVEFYNFFGTREAAYYFRREADGRLFLDQVNEYEFASATGFVRGNQWSVLTEHAFRPDGTSSVVVRRKTPDGSTDVSTTEHRGGDFAGHWEPVPAWGEWASITRRDRSRPA